jgi:FAD dependent oxidoreductase
MAFGAFPAGAWARPSRARCQLRAPVAIARIGSGVGCHELMVALSPGHAYELLASGSMRTVGFGASQLVVEPHRPVVFRAAQRVLTVLARGRGTWRLRAVPSWMLDPGDSEDPARTTCHRSRPTVRSGVLKADVAVYGDGASALGAAVSAARHCLSVVLLSPDGGVGGMLAPGQIGFTDSNPAFTWGDTPLSAPTTNGQLASDTAWSAAGGLLRELRTRIALLQPPPHSLEESLRYEAHVGASAIQQLLRGVAPQLRVLRNTSLLHATLSSGRVTRVAVVGAFNGRVSARYWVDGSDTGELVGALKLHYRLGSESPAAPSGNGDVMAYAYRWTAIEGESGTFPTQAPEYYALNKANFDSQLSQVWPVYMRASALAPGAPYAVQPLRLLNPLGRLSGSLDEPEAVALTGLAPAGPQQRWDVNNGLNDLETTLITEDLRTNAAVPALFARNHLPDPYLQAFDPAWADISYVQDQPLLRLADRTQLVGLIEDAVKARALGLLYYIRSGDMLARLHQPPGGAHVSVRSNWSIDNQLGTPDGLPILMYQREGRRVLAERTESIQDLCPGQPPAPGLNYACALPPLSLHDSIAVGDNAVDIRQSGLSAPTVEKLQAPYQVSFGALIPRGTTGLLVGSALDADRLAYGALRADPLRLMIGGAIGDAIALAAQRHTSFQRLNILSLRDMLADDYQPTTFVRWVPAPGAEGVWGNLELARALQLLIDHGRVAPAQAQQLSPGLALTGALASQLRTSAPRESCLARYLGSPQVARGAGTIPLSSLLGVRQAGPATVGDGYLLLAWCLG